MVLSIKHVRNILTILDPSPLVRKRPRPQPPGRPRAVTGLQTHRYASLGNLPHLRAQQPALLEHPPSSRWFTGRSDPARL